MPIRYNAAAMLTDSYNRGLTEMFAEWLVGEGRADLTAQTYAAELQRLAAWAGPERLSDLDAMQLSRYLRSCRRRGDSPATRNLRLAAIRKFWAWLVLRGIVEQNAASDIPVMRVERGHVSYLPRAAVRALLAALAGNARDTAIFLMVLTTGVRVRELVPMDRDDVEWERAGVSVQVRGDDPVRTVYPSRQAELALGSYLQGRDDPEVALFVSRRGRRLAARSIQGAFAKHFGRAGIAGSLRTVRHTFAVYRTRSGMDPHYLQELMGFKTLQSAHIYHEVDPEELREVARQTEERY
jgi:site-specific recombinase XerD